MYRLLPILPLHDHHGLLLFVAGVFYQCGFFLEYLFGSLTNWRTAAGISACIPILTAIYIALVLLSYSSIINDLSILLQLSGTAC
jgi:hypothetical protein